MLGMVTAGFPSPAEEELVDALSLDDYLIGNRQATFILKVSGDSMRDAGILPDDLVIVDRGLNPKNGDIVIAEVDGEWTMKYLKKNKGTGRHGPDIWLRLQSRYDLQMAERDLAGQLDAIPRLEAA